MWITCDCYIFHFHCNNLICQRLTVPDVFAVSVNRVVELGLIRWQIGKHHQKLYPQVIVTHTLLTVVQEAFRVNTNLVNLFFFFPVNIDMSRCDAWLRTIPISINVIEPTKTPSQCLALALLLKPLPANTSNSRWPRSRALSFCCTLSTVVKRE